MERPCFIYIFSARFWCLDDVISNYANKSTEQTFCTVTQSRILLISFYFNSCVLLDCVLLCWFCLLVFPCGNITKLNFYSIKACSCDIHDATLAHKTQFQSICCKKWLLLPFAHPDLIHSGKNDVECNRERIK